MKTDANSGVKNATHRKAPAKRKGAVTGQGRTANSTSAVASSGAELLAFTIDARTAQIVKLEGLDAAGARRELSDEERARLLSLRRDRTIERVIERAFEAGIACVLEGAIGQEDLNEPSDEMELAYRLLAPLIERSAAKGLFAHDVLDRAILGTLLEHAVSKGTAGGNPKAGSR